MSRMPARCSEMALRWPIHPSALLLALPSSRPRSSANSSILFSAASIVDSVTCAFAIG